MPDTATPVAAPDTTRRANNRATLYLIGSRIGLGAFCAYATIVFTLTAAAEPGHEPVPRTVNGVILTGLFMATVLLFVASGRHRRDVANEQWREEIVTELVAIKDAIGAIQNPHSHKRRVEDEDTHSFAGGRVVYASIAATHGGPVEAFGSALSRQVDQMVDRFRAGVAATLQDADARIEARLADVDEVVESQVGLAAVGRANGVTRLPRSRH